MIVIRRGMRVLFSAIALGLAMCDSGARAALPTTLDDFFIPGTQPDTTNGVAFTPLVRSDNCRNCHELYTPEEVPIYTRWSGSPMAHAARDPVFHAAMAIANQDAAFAGDMCIRCHVPRGWLAGRSTPTDGSALTDLDYDGINCNFCHRSVDPVFKPGISPVEDAPILQALQDAGVLPAKAGNGSYVISPRDVRRGPLDDVPENYHGVPIIVSPFHTTSDICATCHDVSNPAISRQLDGTYALNLLGEPHETLDKYDMFPLERTYSEWLMSAFANGGVESDGRFGGDHPTGVMVTCQDCHMPRTTAWLTAFTEEPFFIRQFVPSHDFNGGNLWLQDMIANLYPVNAIPEYLEDSKVRTRGLLEKSADLEVTVEPCSLRVRVVNETGHKLPTGYPEGRRMWLNVEFTDAELNVLAVRGTYDFDTADLTTSDTKVYEAKLGLDASAAVATGIPEGPSFHFAVANRIYKDNRIPPRGFTNAGFDSVQAGSVGATYVDGQHWDETVFVVPPGATRATVQLYYQTASKEYITFLRDENVTNDAGDVLFNQWELTGKSEPVLMGESFAVDLSPGAPCDVNCDGAVSLADQETLPECLAGPSARLRLGCESFDADLDGAIDLRDVAALQVLFNGAD